MRPVEIGLTILLALGGLGHLAGTLTGYPPGSEVFVWSLSASTLVFVLVVLNLLRIGRPGDRALALLTIAALVAWAGLALAFGAAVGNVADPRALSHALVSLVLAALAGRSLARVPAAA